MLRRDRTVSVIEKFLSVTIDGSDNHWIYTGFWGHRKKNYIDVRHWKFLCNYGRKGKYGNTVYGSLRHECNCCGRWIGEWSESDYNSIKELQTREPQLINDAMDGKGVQWWYYKDEFWITNELHDSEDIGYLIDEILIKEKEKVNRAKRKVKSHVSKEPPKNENRRIPQDVMDRVWKRDEGKCVDCGSNENLEFDHIIPFSKGGSNTYRNLQLLCEHCNRSKSAKIG